MTEYRVEKQGYSRGAWRVLDTAGQQVYATQPFEHPNLGWIPLHGPVCFDRKRDAVAWIAAESAASVDAPDSGEQP